MGIIIIEDYEPIVTALREMGFKVYENAEDALNELCLKSYRAVFCDIHGIERNGIDAHHIADFCQLNDVRCVITSGDPEAASVFRNKYGFPTIQKSELIKRCFRENMR